MKKTAHMVFLFSFLVIIECAGPTGGLKFLEEPNDGNVVIVGNVIIENINQEFSFDNWDYSSQVVIMGKTADGTLNNYTATTDPQGYYCLPNVPPGRYALKAVLLPIPGGTPLKLVNDLDSRDSEFYRMRHPEREIEYTANWLPPMIKGGRIINLGITWFGLRTAEVSDLSVKSIGIVVTRKFDEDLRAKRLYNIGYPYTRNEPLTYFKKKFPDSGWWKFQ